MFRVNGFFGHIKRNDLMSALMFVGFMVAAQIMAAVVLSVPLLFLDSQHSVIQLGGYLTRYAPLVLIGSTVVFWVLFKEHVNKVREQLGFRYLAPNEDRRLSTIVETLAITAGIPTPKIGIIETSARNAFACGMDPKSAVVVVTRGLLNALSHDELEAVIAHEITHIVNGDIRLIAAANVMLYCLEWVAKKNPFKNPPWWAWIFIPIWSLLIIAKMLGNASKFALDLGKVSRLLIASSREFVADAEAVRLTHKPAALISALRKIEHLSSLNGLQPENDAMMIDGATHGDYATHPSITDRIAAVAKHANIQIEVSQPTRAPVPQVLQPKLSLWRRVNNHLDEQDAKEQAKFDATPTGKLKNLFERVQTDKKPSKWEGVRASIIPIMFVLFFVFPTIIGNMKDFGVFQPNIAEKQPDGSYVRFGVKLTAEEHKKMARDMRHAPNSSMDFAPSRLKSDVTSASTGANGLRGRSFEDDVEGAL